MTIAPWGGEVRDGRVYGRGSCDIKGGMASMIAAMSRLAQEPVKSRPTIVMACSVNEELGSSGAHQMARSWASGNSKLVPRVPDAVIVAEPTGLDVVVAHRGVARWYCRTHGRAAHSSRPSNGQNAIYGMARVLSILEEYAKSVVGTLGSHPLVDSPTLSVGRIVGGISVNTVPDLCSIEIDRRVLPGENPQAAQQHAIDYIAARIPPDVSVEHVPLYIATAGLNDRDNQLLANQLVAAAQRLGRSGQKIGVPYGTDAPAFDAIRAPTVVFGPGSIEQAHTCDEWIEVEQLRAAVDVLVEFGRDPGIPART